MKSDGTFEPGHKQLDPLPLLIPQTSTKRHPHPVCPSGMTTRPLEGQKMGSRDLERERGVERWCGEMIGALVP